MISNLKYEVIEDNAGGLHLFVFEKKDDTSQESIIYAHSGYERVDGQLLDDLESLADLSDPRDWDGCEESPQEDYEHMTGCEYGYEIIASRDYNGVAEIYADKMGLSGLNAFNLNQDD